jgi:hypothetical protein
LRLLYQHATSELCRRAGTEEDYTSNNLNQIVARENHAVAFSGTAASDALVKGAGRPGARRPAGRLVVRRDDGAEHERTVPGRPVRDGETVRPSSGSTAGL